MVAGFYLGITRHDQSFAISACRMVVPGSPSSSLPGAWLFWNPLLHRKFRHIGVGKGQLYIADVRVQHHLVDMAGGNHFFVDDGAYVQTLGHAYVVDAFHFRHGLCSPHPFWRRGRQGCSSRSFR